jgi:hypothetical protein
MRHKITLKANFNAGEGDIGNVLEFRYSNDPLMRADLLKDWIFLLEEEYEEALLDMRAEYKGLENVPSNV